MTNAELIVNIWIFICYAFEIVCDDWRGMLCVIGLASIFYYVKKLCIKTRDEWSSKGKATKKLKEAKEEFKKENYDVAIEFFKDIIKHGFYKDECSCYIGRVHLSKAYLNKQEYYTAINFFDTALKTNPKHSDSHFYNAIAKRMIGDYENSHENFIQYYDTINCNVAIKNIVRYYEIALMLNESNNFQEAQKSFYKARTEFIKVANPA